MPTCKYLLCWPGRQGVREKYFTAKGVRSPKSLGTAALGRKRSFKTHRPPYPTRRGLITPGKRPRNSYITNLDGLCQRVPEGETYPKTTRTGKATKTQTKRKSGRVL